MRIINEEPFDKVVHSWLKAEWIKHTYDTRYPELQHLIDSPNFNSSADNATRLRLLNETRSVVLQWLPADTRWYSAAYSPEDVSRTYIIPSDDWLQITSHTFHMPSTLPNVESDAGHGVQIRDIHSTLPNPEIDTKIIVVGSSIESPITIIEGNHRGTALLKYQEEHLENPLLREVYLGLSDNMHQNNWHIEHPRNSHHITSTNLSI